MGNSLVEMWKYKLSAITGVLFLLLSSPFIVGLMAPSMHEGSIYAQFYVIINYLPILMLKGLIEWIVQLLFDNPTLYRSNIVSIFIVLLFWIVIAWLVGSFIDARNSKK